MFCAGAYVSYKTCTDKFVMCQPHIFTHAYVSYRNKHGQVRVMCVSYKTKFGGSPNWMSQHFGEIPIVSISGYFHCFYIPKKIRCFHWRKSYQKWDSNPRGQCPLNLKSNALNRSAILVCVHYGKYVNAILLFFFSLTQTYPHSFIKNTQQDNFRIST